MLLRDADYDKEQARLKGMVEHWSHILGCDWASIRYEYERGYATDEASAETMAKTSNLNGWPYREFVIHFYMANTIDRSNDEVESTVIHELTHTILAPMHMQMNGIDDDTYNYAHDLVEMVTTNITQAIQWSFEAGTKKDDPKASLTP